MRAAIYLRVSTDHDEQKLSPEHQLATCQEHARELGLWTGAALVYNDAGASGTEMAHRAEVQRLVTDARAGKFGAVLFTAISRFARDLSDALALKKRLEAMYGVRIISVEEGYDSALDGRNSEMIFTVHAMVAAHKSQEMSKAIRRGLRQSAAGGRHIGNVCPYGYQKNADKKLVPDLQSAPIIQEIFRLYLTGLGSKAIAKTLNRRGVPTAKSTRAKGRTLWQASTILSILHNPVYTGTLVANKWRNEIDVGLSRQLDLKVKRQMMREQKHWVVVEDDHEAIIDAETFVAVQNMLAMKASHKGVKRNSHLLSGLMRCAECGGAMIVTGRNSRTASYKYVVCAATRRIGKEACSNQTSFKYEDALTAVLAPLRAVFAHDETIERMVERIWQAGANDGICDRIDQVKKQLEHNETRQIELVRAFTNGTFSLSVVSEHQQELEMEAERLQDELVQLEADKSLRLNRMLDKDEIRARLQLFRHVEQYDTVTARSALAVVLDQVMFTADKRIKVVYRWGDADFAGLNISLT